MSLQRPRSAIPRLWRGGPAVRPEVRKANARRRRVFVLQATIMALAGAIVGMLYWIRPIPTPRLIPLLEAGTESKALIPLPMAEADLRGLERAGVFSLHGKPTTAEERIRLVSDLDDLKSIGNIPIVVYLRAYSRVNVTSPKPGSIMIVPSDADAVNSEKWVSLQTALKALKACRSSQKLLLLDILQGREDPATALLPPGLAGRIDDELKAVADPRRVVLTACSAGESALASDDLGRSVFGFYLEEGLRGWADVDVTGIKRDGLVTVADLAGYVSSHVDRWARLNRQARQRPQLFADGARVSPQGLGDLDFPLAVLVRGRPAAHLAMAKPRAYPDWLAQAWRRLDHFQKARTDRVAPWTFRRAEAALLWSDQAWRAGYDPAQVKAFVTTQLDGFVARQEALRAGPRPEPHSLALLSAAGLEPEPALLAAIEALAKKSGAPTPEKEKDKDKPSDIGADASDRDLALAVFRVAAELPEPSAKTILALDGLLKPRGAPQFLETLSLRQVADLAESDPSAWSPALAHRVLDLASRAGRAENRPLPLSWVVRALNQAAQARHDGEVLLFERGFASAEVADAVLVEADRLYNVVLSAQNAIEEARLAFDDATFLLPPCAAYLDDAPQLEVPWSAALSAARDVSDALGVGRNDEAPPVSDLPPRVDALRQKSSALIARLKEIRDAIAGQAGSLAQTSGRSEPDAVTVASIDALLSTPFPNPETRLSLWSVRHELSRRLAEETLKLDHSATGWTAPDESDDSDSSSAIDLALAASAARRARRAIDLLALAGLDPKELAALDSALGRATASDIPADWLALAQLLRKGWVEGLPLAFKSSLAADPAAADRLSRLLPPFAWFSGREEVVARLDDVATNPARRLRNDLNERLWAWQADRYQYEANDPDRSDLLAEAARGFRSLSPPPQAASVQFERVGDLAELTPEHPATELTLQLHVIRSGTDNPRIAIDVPGLDPHWLRVRPIGATAAFPLAVATPPSGVLNVPIRIEMTLSGAANPLPRGFLVRARVDGRSFHLRVPVTLLPASERLKVLLSEDPESPTAPRGDLRLRPVEGRQTFHLYLFNPTPRARKVSVALKMGDLPVPGATAVLSVEPGKAGKVSFTSSGSSPSSPTTSAPASEPELPELKGSLTAIVTDADHPERWLATRTIRVAIASAAEYVRVAGSKFQPTGPGDEKNHLTVSLTANAPLSGPPCRAELILPPEWIPSLVEPPADGSFRGVVPPDDTPLTLRASGLKLADFGSEKGAFYLNIDARKRALIFRTTFATHGDATTPRLDFEPAIRLQGDDAAATGARFKIDVEVDNPPPASTLDVSLGRIGSDGFEEDVVVLRGGAPYRRRIGFGVRDGALAFEATETDWSIPIDTSGVEGRRAIRARLFRPDGSLVREAQRLLTLDAGAPAGVQFVDLPAQIKRGKTLLVRASGQPSESGTRQVVFFLGTPTAEGKRPADAKLVEGQPIDPNRKVWAANVRLPDDRKGPLPISVQFINGIGRSTFATAEIELLETDPVLRGGLRVRVNEGDRPQPGLEVYVYDAKGASVKGRGRTDENGTILFEDLEAGPSLVVSAKPATPSDIRAPVTVVAGTTTSLDLTLLFRTR